MIERVDNLPPETLIFGRTKAMLQVRQIMERVAGTALPVLIEGETGTGKEIIAHLLHNRSCGNTGAFIKVHCPSMPSALLESKILGCAAGNSSVTKQAINGAEQRGTLFLDEISELEGGVQSRLLQVVSQSQYFRIETQGQNALRARLVCTTNRDLHAAVANGKFRQDLYCRITAARLYLPPLRERRVDIPDMVNYFLRLYDGTLHGSSCSLNEHVVEALQKYSWPGNTRQLENLIRRYAILGAHAEIVDELGENPSITSDQPQGEPNGWISMRAITKSAVRELEAELILNALEENGWNRKHAARALSISYRALRYKIRDAGLLLSRRKQQASTSARQKTQRNNAALSGATARTSEDV